MREKTRTLLFSMACSKGYLLMARYTVFCCIVFFFIVYCFYKYCYTLIHLYKYYCKSNYGSRSCSVLGIYYKILYHGKRLVSFLLFVTIIININIKDIITRCQGNMTVTEETIQYERLVIGKFADIKAHTLP